MIRLLHRWAALPFALILIVVSLSGAALSVFPLLNTGGSSDLSIGALAQRVAEEVPGAEQISRSPSGQITAVAFGDTGLVQMQIDPATGQALAAVSASPTESWLEDLHRALFAGDTGRIIIALSALALFGLTLSGYALAVRRMGGWRQLFAPVRGSTASRWHLWPARLAGPFLMLSTLTALWMSAATFGFVPEGSPMPAFPATLSTAPTLRYDQMQALDGPVTGLQSLQLPRANDPRAVLTLATDSGSGYVDPGTGALTGWAARSLPDRIMDWVHLLHTGQGAALFGLLLGLSVLSVPLMAGTGTVMWWNGRRAKTAGGYRNKTRAEAADTILLVGSEGGTTWGFARATAKALEAAGQKVHLAALSAFAPESYTSAEQILLFAATYGDGDAPASAGEALARISATPAPMARFAVLGFGDRGFPAYCAYAEALRGAALSSGWRELLPMARIDRQSDPDFQRWGQALAAALGKQLSFSAVQQDLAPTSLTLVSRRDYGEEVQAPLSILRFDLPRRPRLRRFFDRLAGRDFGGFQPGDLLGVLPEGDNRPRYYSLASGHADGFVEICVRKQPAGLCSGQLTGLEPGQSIRAFLRPNPAFHPQAGETPLILIGAGAGIGALAGFARGNRQKRPIHLYAGSRAAESDAIYAPEFALWQREGRLTRLSRAFSRGPQRAYVQDLLRADAARLAALITEGARVMVCGGREMAQGVTLALAEVLAPTGLTPATLKAEGRYVEDIF
ncbi:PepSY domain-containing protein [Phaeovulum sp. W22_SRMD_FR3]|uniref:PepSY domain-containing protein n=1 Tax=Phaeovulum sp. W22_SRMD_FR3 TaxID=3240274 RepID=UPI003F974CFD